jgi:nondiscriminating glutamyl-tRNA synthetase
MVRVRFAPSPTGHLHIGTLRTAIFNWLYAKHHSGTFILRIEDTDQQRSNAVFEASIIEGLSWLNLTLDEGPDVGGNYGPYRQSERMRSGIYSTYCDRLIASKQAYYCFETDEELEEERAKATSLGIPYKYSRKSLYLSEENIVERLKRKDPYTIRFKIPDSQQLTYTDGIRGDITFDMTLVSDFVLLKSDGSPSYNFACVVDDAEMEISDVIRGEDHISNMPKQLSLYQALGIEAPKFSHMPMILGPDKAKMSKRHGATNVIDYREKGYLCSAFLNFLSLLGWSSGTEEEFFTQEQLIKEFSLNRVSKSNAVFDITKLNWMNGQYIRKQSPKEFLATVLPYIKLHIYEGLNNFTEKEKELAAYSVITNLTVLSDINEYLGVYVKTEPQFLEDLRACRLDDQQKKTVSAFYDKLSLLETFTKEDIDQLLESIVKETGLGKGKVLLPIRLALTGQRVGPSIGDFVVVFGKEKCLERLLLC